MKAIKDGNKYVLVSDETKRLTDMERIQRAINRIEEKIGLTITDFCKEDNDVK